MSQRDDPQDPDRFPLFAGQGRCKARLASDPRPGFESETIIYIGAFKSRFTRWARREFPNARAVMFKANAEWEFNLRAMQNRLGEGVEYRISLVGTEPRESARLYCGGAGSFIYREMTGVNMQAVYLPVLALGREAET